MSENVTVPALLPCPFCGGPAFIAAEGAPVSFWYAECLSQQCAAVGPGETRTRDEAIAAWNHRSTPTLSTGGETARQVAAAPTIAKAPPAAESHGGGTSPGGRLDEARVLAIIHTATDLGLDATVVLKTRDAVELGIAWLRSRTYLAQDLLQRHREGGSDPLAREKVYP